MFVSQDFRFRDGSELVPRSRSILANAEQSGIRVSVSEQEQQIVVGGSTPTSPGRVLASNDDVYRYGSEYELLTPRAAAPPSYYQPTSAPPAFPPIAAAAAIVAIVTIGACFLAFSLGGATLFDIARLFGEGGGWSYLFYLYYLVPVAAAAVILTVLTRSGLGAAMVWHGLIALVFPVGVFALAAAIQAAEIGASFDFGAFIADFLESGQIGMWVIMGSGLVQLILRAQLPAGRR